MSVMYRDYLLIWLDSMRQTIFPEKLDPATKLQTYTRAIDNVDVCALWCLESVTPAKPEKQ